MEGQGSIACLAASLLVIGVIGCAVASGSCPTYTLPHPAPNMAPSERIRSVRGVWQQQQQTQQPLNSSCLGALQHQASEMFDHGFSHYMKRAFPKDNLLPISCRGADWQGGVGLTLIDSLDMLLLLNRRADIQEALQHLGAAVSFEKDAKVHVFETTIRVLGGLLSGHVLLDADRGIAPEYDGLLLSLAVDLGERLLAAFKTPSGLPGLHVHLQKGMIDTEHVSCTACAGTLLLEFGLLSKLTGREDFMEAAHHAAQLLFDQRSRLGLVGSGFHVVSRTWSQRDSTIGPGSDSYYEYLLKAYLMFGDRSYLDMFTQLYVATMRHMQVPGAHGASSSAFLLDVHMDSGRLLKPWVSSLGAFWPAMQVLAGQHADAARLHSNFTAAWSTWGWLPEVFGADLSAVHPEDPGYNLRPEHIESTWYLKALTGDPTGQYTRLAASIMQVLNHSRVECGYAPIKNVYTGSQTDLMESYFLSETMKYLYLSFIDSAPLLDYYLLSTEGHLMPVFPHASESDAPGLKESEHGSKRQQKGDSERRDICTSSSPTDTVQPHTCSSENSSDSSALVCDWDKEHIVPVNTSGNAADTSLVGKPLQQLPSNCWELCAVRAAAAEDSLERRLRAALPLLPVRRVSSRRIRYRRCVACIHTTEALAASPPDSTPVRLARLNYGHGHAEVAAGTPIRTPANSLPPDVINQLGTAAQGVVLAQLVCVLKRVGPKGRSVCKTLRRLTALDTAVGLDGGTLILQLTAIPQQPLGAIAPTATLLVGYESAEELGPVVLQLTGAAAAFGPLLPDLSSRCLEYLSQPRVRLAALPSCPVVRPGQPPGYLHSSSWERWRLQQQRRIRMAAAGSGTSIGSGNSGDQFWVRDSVAADSWIEMSPSAHTCWPLLQQAEAEWFAAAAAAAADWLNSSTSLDSGSTGDHSQQQESDNMQHALGANTAMRDVAPSAAATLSYQFPTLMASCAGYDANSELGGTWVSAAEFKRPGAGCEQHSVSELPRAAPLVMTRPRDACGGYLENAAMVQGAIAVVLRGNCGFLDKVMAADAAGAVGVVVLNVRGKGELLVMSGDESGRSPDIPAVLVGGDDATRLMWLMERRPLIGAMTAYNTVEAQQQQSQQEESKLPEQGEQQQQEARQRGSSRGKERRELRKQQAKQASSKRDIRAAEDKQKAAASAAVGAALLSTETAAGQPAAHALVQTKVDLLVPGRSQKWLQDNVVKAGGDVNAVYAAVLRDPRVMSALQRVMNGNRGSP